MKILAPVKNLLSGIEIIKHGSEEIYFGIVSKKWEQKYDYKTILNRRDGYLANINSFDEAKQLIDFAKENGTKTYITLNNSPLIINEKEILEEISNIIKLKPNGLIVKDLYIATLIRKINQHIDIHCSSLNQIINSEGIKFWIKEFNIKRMIFPRNIGVNEIKNLTNKFPELEFEIFIKNDWCYNTDGFCSSLHLEGLKEGIPYVCNREKNYISKNKSFEKKFLNLYKNSLNCKICILSQLRDIKNLVSIKIVGREKPLNIILNDLKFIKNSLEFLNLTEDNKQYINFNINLYKKIFKKECNYKNCELYNKYYK